MSELVPTDAVHVLSNYRDEETDPVQVARLADDMRVRGYVETFPIQVRTREEGGYWITSGHHRHAAAILAGIELVPVVLVEEGPKDALLSQLGENLARKNSNPLEEGRAFLSAIEEHGATIEEICSRVCHGERYILDRIAIARLDPSAAALACRYGIGYGTILADLPRAVQAELVRSWVPGMNLDAWTIAVGNAREAWQESMSSGLFDMADMDLAAQEWSTDLGAYVTDAVQVVEESRAPTVPLGREEIATMLQVRVGTVSQWITRGIFPAEDMRVSGSPLWWPATVESWAQETGRLETV